MARMCLLVEGLHCEDGVHVGDPECEDCAVTLEAEIRRQWQKHVFAPELDKGSEESGEVSR
jgi:hypothetical protein